MCLGVTCHYLYSLHRRLHNNIYLNFYDTPDLPYLLEDWMGPEYAFYRMNFRFVTREKFELMKYKEKEFWEGYFERMKIEPTSRRLQLVKRSMDVWERGFRENV